MPRIDRMRYNKQPVQNRQNNCIQQTWDAHKYASGNENLRLVWLSFRGFASCKTIWPSFLWLEKEGKRPAVYQSWWASLHSCINHRHACLTSASHWRCFWTACPTGNVPNWYMVPQSCPQKPLLWNPVRKGWMLKHGTSLQPVLFKKEPALKAVRDVTHLYCQRWYCYPSLLQW